MFTCFTGSATLTRVEGEKKGQERKRKESKGKESKREEMMEERGRKREISMQKE